MTGQPPMSTQPDSSAPSRAGSRVRAGCLVLSLALCGFAAACYSVRPDACAAVTVWPVWTWFVAGLLLCLPALRLRPRWPVRLVLAAWLAYLLVLAEEPSSIARAVIHPSPALTTPTAPGTFRVVSLNCAGGDAAAAAEVAAYHPDIVLLQESPSRGEVQALARRLYGQDAACDWGPDGSLLAHGSATIEAVPVRSSFFVHARLKLPQGLEVVVISLRLTPSVFRMDLWNPECWSEYTANRRIRSEQLREVTDRVVALPPDVPVLLGGDMNAPAGDAIFRLLRPRLRDAFAEAGRGWGDTITNELPVLRIDQVWVSRQFDVVGAWARRTVHSDHRMVVCDLRLTRR